MKTERTFVPDGNRYTYDVGFCSSKAGYAQVDTGQDAWYFGVWANPVTFTIVTYAEGDLSVEVCEDVDEFRREMLSLIEFYRNSSGNCAIDPGAPFDWEENETAQAFVRAGLGDYLH